MQLQVEEIKGEKCGLKAEVVYYIYFFFIEPRGDVSLFGLFFEGLIIYKTY